MGLEDNRRKVGLVVPSVNIVMEAEFERVLSPTIETEVARVPYESNGSDAIRGMNRHVPLAVNSLWRVGSDLVSYGCTLGSMLGGPSGEQRLIQEIQTSSERPVLTTGRSVVGALVAVRAESVVVVTPYEDSANEEVRRYMAESGLDVVAVVQLPRSGRLGMVEEQTTRDYIREQVRSIRSDGIFVSCTGLRTFGILPALSEDTSRPVVSSNSAVLWATLNQLGVKANVAIEALLNPQSQIDGLGGSFP